MKFEHALRDLWEGGVTWNEAIQMIGAPEELVPYLRRSWCSWNRKHYGEPEDAF